MNSITNGFFEDNNDIEILDEVDGPFIQGMIALRESNRMYYERKQEAIERGEEIC
jgi:hypothetical protein